MGRFTTGIPTRMSSLSGGRCLLVVPRGFHQDEQWTERLNCDTLHLVVANPLDGSELSMVRVPTVYRLQQVLEGFPSCFEPALRRSLTAIRVLKIS